MAGGRTEGGRFPVLRSAAMTVDDHADPMIPTTVLVTGASGGIGSAVVERLSHDADLIIATGRSEPRLAALAPTGRAALRPAVLDVSAADAHSVTSALLDEAGPGRLVLVNAAGDFGPVGGIGADDPGAWAETLRAHVVGAVATMTAALPRMMEEGWGRVVNVSSAQSLHGPDPAAGAYATAKAALNVVTAGAALQVEGTEVSVCAVHPGDVDSAMAEDIRRKSATAGPAAAHLASWAAVIGSGGGDDPAAAGVLVAEIVTRPALWSNGRFLFAAGSAERHPDTGWSIPVGPSDGPDQ